MGLLVSQGVFEQLTEYGPSLILGLAFKLVVAHPGCFADVVNSANIVPLWASGGNVAGLNLAASALDVIVEVGLDTDAARSSVFIK